MSTTMSDQTSVPRGGPGDLAVRLRGFTFEPLPAGATSAQRMVHLAELAEAFEVFAEPVVERLVAAGATVASFGWSNATVYAVTPSGGFDDAAVASLVSLPHVAALDVPDEDVPLD